MPITKTKFIARIILPEYFNRRFIFLICSLFFLPHGEGKILLRLKGYFILLPAGTPFLLAQKSSSCSKRNVFAVRTGSLDLTYFIHNLNFEFFCKL